MRQRQAQVMEQVNFSNQIREFLSSYRVDFCQVLFPHHYQYCYQHHDAKDMRRNPYKEHGFLYHPSEYCNCQKEDCNRCHNEYEYYYHPLVYKTSKCPNYRCQVGLQCIYYHDNELQMLMRYQFFRFDLELFKTEICPNRQQPSNMHELASCRFYHNESDRRRNPRKIPYSHVQCEAKSCNIATCLFAHNKIQQLYHPARYKTKYCQSFINKKTCQYNQYCSFAHSDEEVKIQLLHLMEINLYFEIYKYKTVWCPYTHQHDRSTCIYAHNFQDYRRDPKKIKYSPEICSNWTKGQIKSLEASGCELKMDCNKCHGWLQHKFHPIIKLKEAGKTQSQLIPPEKIDPTKPNEKKKGESNNSYGVGAPFFQKDEKPQKPQIERGNSATKPKENIKNKAQTGKGFNFAIFLPVIGQDTLIIENANEIDLEWSQEMLSPNLEKLNEPRTLKDAKSTKKCKISKKTKVEYTKSLKQLITVDSLYEKLISNKINQIKLLSFSKQDLQKFEMNNQEKQLVMNAIQEYSKSHKLDKVKYTDSMARFFSARKLGLTMDKLRKRGVTQSFLQRCSESTIQEFSFLEEQEKFTLPKVIDQYKDDHAFRQLYKQIEKQAFSNNTVEQKSKTLPDFKT